ncbi:MAG: hypothetical protein LBH19_02010 [Dysgonamonadaceae bacterium]|jgi:hypothetical protein|nr:hypothetical protein [Dysgonamonadaceae bacterium]
MNRIKQTLILFTFVFSANIGYAQLNTHTDTQSEKQIKTEQTVASLKRQISILNKQLKDLQEEYANRNVDFQDTLQILQQENAILAEKNTQYIQQFNEVASQYPIIIKSINFGNFHKDGTVETVYGSTLYSKTAMYLKPQIEYIGLKPNQTITIQVKLYMANALLKKTKTTDTRIFISDEGKVELNGPGYDKKGRWVKGVYSCEIWYNNVCLKAVDFTLH